MLKKICFLCFGIAFVCGAFNAYAEEMVEEVVVEELTPDEISAQALEDYQVEGSLFERITTLEQEKLVMQLEKERIELDLALDRLNKEKIKVQQELEDMSGRADRQQQELEAARAELEEQTLALKKKIEALDARQEEAPQRELPKKEKEPEEEVVQIVGKYKLLNVVGVGNQLQATIQDITTGQNKRISVGKQLDGYIVKSISLNDGIVFEKDGVSENLNVGK